MNRRGADLAPAAVTVQRDPALQIPLLLSPLAAGCRVLEFCVAGHSRLVSATEGFLPGEFSVCELPAGGLTAYAEHSRWPLRSISWQGDTVATDESSFDLVLLTGFGRLVEGKSLARAAVCEAKRLCRPGGSIAWSENNAWALWMSLAQLGQRGGWSLAAMQQQLRTHGWETVGDYLFTPDALRPGYAIPLRHCDVPPEVVQQVLREQFLPLNRAGLRPCLKGLAATLARRPWAQRFGPAWHVTASQAVALSANAASPRDEVRTPFLDRLVQHALQGPACPLALLVRRTHAVVVPTWDNVRRQLVYCKLPLSLAGWQALTAQQTSLVRLAQLPPSAVTAPQLIAVGKFEGQPYHVESALEGTGGGRIRAPLDTLVSRAMAALIRFQTATRQNDVNVVTSLWNQRLEELNAAGLIESAQWSQIAAAVRRQLGPVPKTVVPCAVFAHNDFHLGNVIFDAQTQVSGILDWDLADELGLPVCDAIHLTLSAILRRKMQPRGQALLALARGEYASDRRALSDYFQALEIPDDLAPWLPFYAATHLWRLSRHAAFSPPGTPQAAGLQHQAAELVTAVLPGS